MRGGVTLPARWRVIDWPAPARWALTVAFFGALNWLLLAPADTFRDVHIFLACEDKIAHLAIFLALAFLARWSLPAAWAAGVMGLAVLGGLEVYAGSIEVFQPLLAKAGRQFEWLDMACNFLGVGGGWLVGGMALVAQAQEDIHSGAAEPGSAEPSAAAFAGSGEDGS